MNRKANLLKKYGKVKRALTLCALNMSSEIQATTDEMVRLKMLPRCKQRKSEIKTAKT